MIEYKRQLRHFEQWNIRKKDIRRRKKEKGKEVRHRKRVYYCDDILTFDIETTSAWIDEHGDIIAYKRGYDADYWNSLEALSLPYIWQFGFNDTVYYGREFTDFLKVLDDIPKNYKCIIWIHNLGFEYEFLQDILTFNKVFAKTPHKPIYATCLEYPNIEFRCSYMMTNMSLETWGESIGIPKKVEDLNYEVIRTPLTPLNDIEMGYCETDILVMYAGIKDTLKHYKTQWDIPYTSTGKIRRVVKQLLTSDDEYVKYIKKLVPASHEEYQMLMDAFAGGYTHANRIHAGEVQTDYDRV